MQHTKTTSLSVAHRFPAPVSDTVMEQNKDAITMRYDGVRVDGENYFFVVLSVDDLAKVSETPLDLALEDIDGDTAFFRQTPSGPCLYLEMETHVDRLADLHQLARDGEIKILDCIGDLKLMGAPLEMRAPDVAAYQENGFPEIPAEIGYDLMSRMARLHARARIEDEDSSLSAGF